MSWSRIIYYLTLSNILCQLHAQINISRQNEKITNVLKLILSFYMREIYYDNWKFIIWNNPSISVIQVYKTKRRLFMIFHAVEKLRVRNDNYNGIVNQSLITFLNIYRRQYFGTHFMVSIVRVRLWFKISMKFHYIIYYY